MGEKVVRRLFLSRYGGPFLSPLFFLLSMLPSTHFPDDDVSGVTACIELGSDPA